MNGRHYGRYARLRFAALLICAHAWLLLPAGVEAANCERNPNHRSCSGDGDPPPQGDGSYVLYLDKYVYGDFYLARLPDLTVDNPAPVTPELVTLKNFKGKLGNPDVSPDGRSIVFGAVVRNDWNIYTGDLDVVRREVTNITPLADRRGVREEDPRYSWDGAQVVYKCNGDICLFPEMVPNPVVSSACELWGPSFHPSGTMISFTARCGDDETDRILVYDLGTGQTTEVPNADGGPDRFSHFRGNGRLVYSHLDPQDGTASLWSYFEGSISLFHDRTISDDDPYADKRDWEYLAFIGYEGGYNLFMYRESRPDSVQLTQGRPVLGPVVFHVEQSP